MNSAVKNKNDKLECLKYLHENGCPWDTNTRMYAISASNLKCLIYLDQNNCPHSPYDLYEACCVGNLECLKYLHEKYSQQRDVLLQSCGFANGTAKNGHLECLKYLHKNNYPWNKDTCYFATEMGRLECLKYLHENGCPWGETSFMCAVREGHLECLKYLIENNCEINYERISNFRITDSNRMCIEYINNLNNSIN